MNTKIYMLVNNEGCLMAKDEETSYRKAYDYFKRHYSGSYRIIYGNNFKDNIKSVRFA